MKISLLHFFLLIAAACLAAPAMLSVPAPTGAKLTFRRVFKGSSPELIEITVREDSDAAAYEIRQLDEDPGSLPFQVSAAWRTKMFDLAAQLKHFQGLDLDVHRKIANLGEKTFRWESGPEDSNRTSTAALCRNHSGSCPFSIRSRGTPGLWTSRDSGPGPSPNAFAIKARSNLFSSARAVRPGGVD
ncbi:MAG: hypothetical protein DMG51_18630 [Acidobacteria bacterium]|nr:MAG: hypothetical protein DMG51_18630 [Acidobacteriota bacterium]